MQLELAVTRRVRELYNLRALITRCIAKLEIEVVNTQLDPNLDAEPNNRAIEGGNRGLERNVLNRKTLSARTIWLIVASSGCTMLALMAGFFLGQRNTPPPLPPMLAAAAASSDTMAVATGQISKDAEGIFFLDFITGDLQCLVYYPRSGGFGARYFTNALPHLGGGGGKNSKYLMVTGQAVVTSSAGGSRPGASLVYVTDVTTGMFAAFAVPWDQTAESGNRMQSGGLVYVGGGPIRNYQLRDPAFNPPAGIIDPNQK
jgi:hypothetical protein